MSLGSGEVDLVETEIHPLLVGRTVNEVTVNWDDLNGNRIVDCNILGMLNEARRRQAQGVPNPNTVSGGAECASFTGGFLIDRMHPWEERRIFGPLEVDSGRTRVMRQVRASAI